MKRTDRIQIIENAVKLIQEQDLPIASVPSSPVPPPPATNASATAMPPQGAPQAAAPVPGQAPGGEVFTVDEMIDRLNMIRGGRSFALPEVYGQLVTYFGGLSEQDKAAINKFLESINRIVIQVPTENQGAQGGGTQPPMQQAPVSPSPAPTGAPIQESLRRGIKFCIGAEELEFGSPKHLKILQGLLIGLKSLRDCYHLGSANRHVYSHAVSKLKRHLESYGASPL